jgi:enoyl-CoA hydratase/carnithine racemase
MSLLQIENNDGVAVIKFNRGVTNPLNQAFVDEFIADLKQLKDVNDVNSVVVTSSNNKFFSIGLDIPGLFESGGESFGIFYRAFNRLCLELYTFPKPTVAALSGHAIAGGCILALCCDYRFMAEGKKRIGLNEIKLGVPVPHPADCILRDMLGSCVARDVMETGEFFGPEQALEIGLVDKILPLEQVLQASIEKARELGSFVPSAYAAIKRNRVEQVAAQVESQLDKQVKLFVDCWYSETSRELLKVAREKF